MHLRFYFYGVLTCMCIVLLIGAQSAKRTGPESHRFMNGVEFNSISRGSLLKILAALEENLKDQMAPIKKKPLFTASFANNKHTRPFIYPKITHLPTDDERAFLSKTTCIQIWYGLWVSLVDVSVGLSYGFSEATLDQLSQHDPPIMINLNDEAWITNILNLFAPLGSLIGGYVMDKYGRKVVLVACEVPVCVGWVVVTCASTAKHIVIGRIIIGVGCGLAMGGARAYISEITLPHLRGAVGVFPNLGMSVGLFLQTILGLCVRFKTVCILGGLLSGGLCLLNCFLHETPHFFLLHGTREDVKKSLQNFRSATCDVEGETDDLFEFKDTNNIVSLNWFGRLKLLFTKYACKPFWIVAIYLLIMQLSGVSIMFIWSVDMMQGSKISPIPSRGDVILSITRFFTGVLSAVLIYRVGRRPLALASSLGVGVICIIFGALIHQKVDPGVFPIVSCVFFVIFATLGYYTLPILIMYEIYPIQIKGSLSGVTVSLFYFMIYGANDSYPYLRNVVGYENVILLFGISSSLGFIFLYFCLPETHDLTLPEIEEYYNDRRATLVSQRNVIAAQLSRSTGRLHTSSQSLTDKKSISNQKFNSKLDLGPSKKR